MLAQGVIIAGAIDDDIQELAANQRGALPLSLLAPFEEPNFGNLFGRSLLLQPISLLLYAGGLIFEEESLREAGIGCSAATFSNTIARHVIARVGGRLRPRYANTPYEIAFLSGKDWERRSFPNGHGSNAMTCASFWSHRFDLGVAEPLLYTMAGAVALARITNGAHWASDTVFGLVFGFVIGRTVAERFADRELKELQSLQTGASVTPALRIGWSIPVRW
jgi:membrane-associated phospholipid phosphatase